MQVFDVILEEISHLNLEEKEMLDEIIHKRIIDEKRDAILKSYEEAMCPRPN